jgi:hypothetical protein
MSLIDLKGITHLVSDSLENSPALTEASGHLGRMADALERLATAAEALAATEEPPTLAEAVDYADVHFTEDERA